MAVRLSALLAGRHLPSGRFLVLISVRGWVEPQSHTAAGRIRSIENNAPHRDSNLHSASTNYVTACPYLMQVDVKFVSLGSVQCLIFIRNLLLHGGHSQYWDNSNMKYRPLFSPLSCYSHFGWQGIRETLCFTSVSSSQTVGRTPLDGGSARRSAATYTNTE
jgi:hypothetical protein